MKNFEELMKDVGVSNFEELLRWIEENPDNELAKDLKEFISFVDNKEKEQK